MVFKLSDILLGNQYIGIEYYTLNNQEHSAFVLLKKRKNSLEIIEKYNLSNSGHFPENWDKSLPVYLIINTSQIIQKEIDSVDPNDEKLIYKAFPNVNLEEFYCEIWRLKTKSVIVIARKKYLDSIVSDFLSQGINLIGINLGVCAVTNIESYVNDKKLATNHQLVSLDEENPIITTKKDFTTVVDYDLNGLQIENSYLLGFCGILQLIVGNNGSLSGNLKDYDSKLFSNYSQKSFFTKGIRLMAASLFIILLINFFVFQHYYKKAEKAEMTLSLNQTSLQQASALKSRIASKQEKVKNFTDLSSSKSSLIINEIARAIPSSILLRELTFDPLEKKIKPEEPIITQNKTILVSGITTNNNDFTNWIEKIETFRKVQNVTIINFGNDETNATVFTIKIVLQ